MKNPRSSIVLTVATAVACLAGCAPKASYQEVGGTDSLITSGVDVQDVLQTAGQILGELNDDGMFPAPPSPRAKVLVEQVVNKTSTPFDLTIVRNGVVRQLVNTRKVEVLAADSRGSQVSKAAQSIQRERAFRGDPNASGPAADPDWVIQISLIDKSAQVRSTTQSNIWMNIDFIDANSGNILFIGEGAVQKQVTKPGLRL